jgi:RNA polymerase sigma factor (sigma-70 family)
MLDLEFIEPSEVDRAASVFHRDGLAVVTDALTDEQFAFLKDGAHRVVAEQTSAIPLEKATSAASGHNPLADAGRAELRGRLREAMTHLTELQRRVLVLYDLEGWRHGEIATELGISAGSSRVHLHVARKTMRKQLTRTSDFLPGTVKGVL